jgi:ATP-dependent Lon protease
VKESAANADVQDHYINVPIDLSQVLFVCTANTLDTVAMPLLDRCEIVWLAGYTHNEKMRIADRFLLPKTLDANGMTPENVKLSDAALDAVVTKYVCLSSAHIFG